MKNVWSLKEVAARLQAPYRSVYTDVQAGRLQAARVGRRYRVVLADLIAYIGEHRARALFSEVEECGGSVGKVRSDSCAESGCCNGAKMVASRAVV